MNTVLYCRRFAQSVAFYETVLGLDRGFANDWFVEFRVAPGAYLSVADEARASVKSAGGAGITLTLRCDDVDDVHHRLVAHGVAPGSVGPRPWGAWGFLVRDPEGTRIEVWTPRSPGDTVR